MAYRQNMESIQFWNDGKFQFWKRLFKKNVIDKFGIKVCYKKM